MKLDSEISGLLDRVMDSGGKDQSEEHDMNIDQEGDKKMQPPKLKKEYQKNNNVQNNQDVSMKEEEEGKKPAAEEMEPDDVFMEIDDDDTPMPDSTNKNDDDDEEEKKNAIELLVQNSITSYSLDCYPYSFSPLLLFTNGGYFDRGYSNYNAVAAFFAPCLKGLSGGDDDGGGEKKNGSGKKNGGRNGRSPRSSAGTTAASSHKGAYNREEAREVSNDIDAAMDANEKEQDNNEQDDDDEEEVYEDNGINMLHGVIYDRKNLTYDELYNHIASTQSLVTCCIDAHFTAFQMLNKNTLLYYDPASPTLRVCKGDNAHYCALYLMMKCGYGDNAHVIENKKYYMSPTSTRLQNHV